MVTFVEAVRLGFAKYADFSGRATRAEYWWWQLFIFLGCIGSLIIGGILGEEMSIILFCLFYLAILVPSLSILFRRLHDAGRSGWWFLITLVPYAGSIVILVFTLQESKEDNEWGANPCGSGNTISAIGGEAEATSQESAEPQVSAKELCSKGIVLYKGGSYDEAVIYLKQAAHLGDAKAICTLGTCYLKGLGVEKDIGMGIELYNNAAQRGNKAAYYHLGLCYERGTGVSQNTALAREYFKKAAEMGHSGAIAKLDAMQ